LIILQNGRKFSPFFYRFGILQELHSDQGRNFESHVLQEDLQRLGVNKTRITPLHPHSDCMVERYIKTIEKHLRKSRHIQPEGLGREVTPFYTSV
jgi:hypothetical protein